MVPCLVEIVAEPDDSRGLAGEINRQSRRAATEKAGYGVKFFPTILKVGARDREVRRT